MSGIGISTLDDDSELPDVSGRMSKAEEAKLTPGDIADQVRIMAAIDAEMRRNYHGVRVDLFCRGPRFGQPLTPFAHDAGA